MAVLFRYIFVFRLFSEVWLMTGGGPARTTEVVAVYLYLEAFRFNAFGAAVGDRLDHGRWCRSLLGAGYFWALRREMAADAR